MKEMIRNVFLVTFTCVLSSTLLSAVYTATRQRIEDNRTAKVNAVLKRLVPGAVKFREARFGDLHGWDAVDGEGKVVAHVIASSERGYSSNIRVLVAVGLDGVCSGVEVVEQAETPGLGTNVAKESFLAQYRGKKWSEIELRRRGGEIDAVTGATISSGAITRAVQKAVKAGSADGGTSKEGGK